MSTIFFHLDIQLYATKYGAPNQAAPGKCDFNFVLKGKLSIWRLKYVIIGKYASFLRICPDFLIGGYIMQSIFKFFYTHILLYTNYHVAPNGYPLYLAAKAALYLEFIWPK